MTAFAALLSVVCVVLYLHSAVAVARSLASSQAPLTTGRHALNFRVGLAWVAHTLLLISSTHHGQQLHFGLFGVALLHSNLMALMALLVNLYRPVQGIYLLALPISAIELSLGLLGTDPAPSSALSAWLQGHIVLSLLAYGVLSIASLQAFLVYWQERALKQHRRGLLAALPSLQTMENILFELIGLGWLLLTVAMSTGFAVLDDAFAQHVAHKTVFTLIAWTVFAVLLLGRYWRGWRGRTAVRITLSAFGLLLLGFVGSQVVMELLLETPH